MKKRVVFFAAIVAMGLFAGVVKGEDNLRLMIREASVRNNIMLAIENARLLRKSLTTADAVAENEGFINNATDCLQKDMGDYCYFAIQKIITANDYYSGRKVVPKK